MADSSRPAGREAARSHGADSNDIHPGCLVRAAGREDLDAINRVVGAAVMSWSLPERVRRLSLPLYRYTSVDLVHLEMVVAVSARTDIRGVAAWEAADATDTPGGYRALLLHGIHVDPLYHRQGAGSRLFMAAERAARAGQYDGLLVKARSCHNALRLRNIYAKHSDGSWGWPEKAPYPAIMVTAAPEQAPESLLEQLSIGGRMVIPVGTISGEQALKLITRTIDGYEEQTLNAVRFVPLLDGSVR